MPEGKLRAPGEGRAVSRVLLDMGNIHTLRDFFRVRETMTDAGYRMFTALRPK